MIGIEYVPQGKRLVILITSSNIMADK